MIAAVRRGQSMRSVARCWGVSLSLVQYWVRRAGDGRLDRVVWENLPPGCRTAPNHTAPRVEELVIRLRKQLREHSALGECGPQAIQGAMRARGQKRIPSLRTIARIVERRGMLDGQRRVRRPPPPRGWFLHDAAQRRAELDSFDIIEDLVIRGGTDVNVLTAISLHGGLCAAWPNQRITAKYTAEMLIEHWRRYGLPGYAKFDNDTVFQGAHQWPDTFGRITRLCLSLQVTPVFTPPRETGFQADIENFNGRWQRAVWRRHTFSALQGVVRQSERFIEACQSKSASRIQDAPARRPLPKDWRLDLQAPLRGVVIFLRRSDEQGRVSLLGRRFLASGDWCHRLVRAEVDLDRHEIRFYALRRREPHQHRHLSTHTYRPVRKCFQG